MGNHSRALAITVFALSLAVAGCDKTGAAAIPTAPTAATPPSAAPTSPAPPTTAPPAQASVFVECDATIVTDEEDLCAAGYRVGSETRSVSSDAAWSSSAPLVVSVNGREIRGVNVGTAVVSATYQGITGQATVTVIAGANGNFDIQFSPIFNTCGRPIRSVLAGQMRINFETGGLSLPGGEEQTYRMFFSQSGGRVSIRGDSTQGGLTFELQLTQVEGGTRRYVGREDISCHPGVAQYGVTMTPRLGG